ncbi:MAG: type II secretion system GspH family protein [Oscillospiraceae bacterium]|jgi:prepilin-type N-terminal cleavage/methylation domain-containing protein|nr:type II secretion system GspH family protein [Oscillospiraceae bacterium]
MKNTKINSKKLKGMTLVECLVALAVFALLGTLVLTATICVLNTKENTDNVTVKTSYQAPVAVKPDATEVTLLNDANGIPGDGDDIQYEIEIAGYDKEINLYRVNGFDSGYTYFEKTTP